MEHISYLTFDCDGTLIDWRKGIETHLGRLLRKKGLSTLEQLYETYVRLEAEEEGAYKKYRDIQADTAQRVAKNFQVSLTKKEAREFVECVPEWAPFEDTVRSLQKLGSLGLKRIILSNIDRDLLLGTISNNKLEVDGFITAEDIGSYKPAHGHWVSFLQKYRVDKSQLLHVAQSIYHDIIPATQLGIKTVWINRYGEKPPMRVTPSYIFRSLEEFRN